MKRIECRRVDRLPESPRRGGGRRSACGYDWAGMVESLRHVELGVYRLELPWGGVWRGVTRAKRARAAVEREGLWWEVRAVAGWVYVDTRVKGS